MTAGRRGVRFVLNCLYSGPILLILWFNWGWHLDQPLVDQLYLADFFIRVGDGTATFSDWFARHEINGHHIVVPRFILTGLAFVTGWSMRAETWLSLAITSLSLVFMIRIAKRRSPGGLNATVEASNLLMAAMLFCLSQYWNWLWGFSFLLFLIHFLFISAVALLDGATSGNLRRRVLMAAACCTLASFTMLHGILTFAALLPSLLALGLKTKRLREVVVIWSGSLAITLVPYAAGLHEQGSRFTGILELDAIDIPAHFFNILGIPVAMFAKWIFRGVHETQLFWPAGLLLTLVFTLASFHFLLRSSEPKRAQAVPWLSIGLFSLGYAAANTVGRADSLSSPTVELGLHLAIYSTPPILLAIATIQLVLLWIDERFPAHVTRQQTRLAAIALALIPFAAIVLANDALALRALLPLRAKSMAYQEVGCFRFARYLAADNTCAIQWLWTQERLDGLQRLGFRDFHSDLEFDAEPKTGYGEVRGVDKIAASRSLPESTVLIHGLMDLRDWEPVNLAAPADRPRNDSIVTGTVRLPGSGERPTTVLLTHAGPRRFFAWAEIDALPVQDDLGRTVYAWHAPIPDSLIRDKPIHAWAYDPIRGVMVRLDGETRLRAAESKHPLP